MWLQNSGLLDKFCIDVLNPPHYIPLKKVRVNEPLNVKQLATALIVILFGIVISSFIFLGEICCGVFKIAEIQDEEDEKRGDKH